MYCTPNLIKYVQDFLIMSDWLEPLLHSVSHRMAISRARTSKIVATAVRMSAGVDGFCWVTSGWRKQANERARNTKQHRSMSRKELNVGLANVCTAAWVSTWEDGKRGNRGQKKSIIVKICLFKVAWRGFINKNEVLEEICLNTGGILGNLTTEQLQKKLYPPWIKWNK